MGEQLRQLDLRNHNRNGESAACCSDISVGEPEHDLFGSEQHTNGYRRIGNYS